MRLSILSLALMLAALPCAAAEPDDTVRAEVDATLLRLTDAGVLPTAEPLVISQPARIHHELGAVLDLAAAGDGAPVLALTPGGAAERLGLQVGDRVQAINGHRLGAGADLDELRAAIDGGNGELTLAVVRGSGALELRGTTDATAVPGYELLLAASAPDRDSTCGRVSVADVFPRKQKLYPPLIMAIDGSYPGEGPTFRLSPGRHTLSIAEQITAPEFTGFGLRRRERDRSDRYKTLEIDVQPGMTYRVATQFYPEHRLEVHENTYWDPIVWNSFPQSCR